mmetsp:Transcript_69635/g.157427  ORF Transcript_69635/g.157427 Transcript_69635/m.157427 type:complete len:241 (-) Transcript_69635:528-1250(-)
MAPPPIACCRRVPLPCRRRRHPPPPCGYSTRPLRRWGARRPGWWATGPPFGPPTRRFGLPRPGSRKGCRGAGTPGGRRGGGALGGSRRLAAGQRSTPRRRRRRGPAANRRRPGKMKKTRLGLPRRPGWAGRQRGPQAAAAAARGSSCPCRRSSRAWRATGAARAGAGWPWVTGGAPLAPRLGTPNWPPPEGTWPAPELSGRPPFPPPGVTPGAGPGPGAEARLSAWAWRLRGGSSHSAAG